MWKVCFHTSKVTLLIKTIQDEEKDHYIWLHSSTKCGLHLQLLCKDCIKIGACSGAGAGCPGGG